MPGEVRKSIKGVANQIEEEVECSKQASLAGMTAMPYKAAVILQDDCLHAELQSCVDVNSVSLLSRP